MLDNMILTILKIPVLLFRVLTRISVQEGNRSTLKIWTESILARIGVPRISPRQDIFEGVSTLCIELNCENCIEFADHAFRVVIRIEPTSSLFTRPTCQTNQRVKPREFYCIRNFHSSIH